MDRIFLVSILAFINAVFPSASASEGLPPPKISLSPIHKRYYEGETVELSCVAQINKTVSGYRFFNQNEAVVPEVVIDGFWTGSLHVTVEREKDETYSCEYWRRKMGQEVLSQRSNALTLQIREAPKKPSLILNDTLPEYHWGDNVSLVCSAPPEANGIVEFQYIGDRQTIQAPNPLDNTDIYNLNITEPKDTGTFSCVYFQMLEDRKVRSRKSDPVFIHLADDPQKPVQGTQLGTVWGRILTTGGAFFTINGLIFLITHCYFLPKVSQKNDS